MMLESSPIPGPEGSARSFAPALAAAVSLWLILSGTSAAADVYRWVDENGKVHYGDRPPATAKPESVEIEAAPQPAPEMDARRRKTRRLLDAIETERQRETTEAERAGAEKARRQHNCDKARRRLEFYQRASALFRRDSDGERVYLDEEQRARALEQARVQVRRWCG